MAEPPVTFAGLLRTLRAEARLTQEELAEASGVRPRTLSDLERGVATTPQRETIRRLADALHLTGLARAQFEAVARGREVPAAARAGGWRQRPGRCRAMLPRLPGETRSCRSWLVWRPGRRQPGAGHQPPRHDRTAARGHTVPDETRQPGNPLGGLERRLQAVAGGRVTESSGGMPRYGSISTRANWPVQPWLRVEEGRSAVSTLGLP